MNFIFMYNSLLNNTDISMNTAVWRHSPVKTVKHFPGNRAQTSIKNFLHRIESTGEYSMVNSVQTLNRKLLIYTFQCKTVPGEHNHRQKRFNSLLSVFTIDSHLYLWTNMIQKLNKLQIHMFSFSSKVYGSRQQIMNTWWEIFCYFYSLILQFVESRVIDDECINSASRQ